MHSSINNLNLICKEKGNLEIGMLTLNLKQILNKDNDGWCYWSATLEPFSSFSAVGLLSGSAS